MARPKKVKVLSDTWKIIYSAAPFSNDDSVGYTDEVSREIAIHSSRPERAVKITVLHEVGHAICSSYGIVVPKASRAKREEALVSQWAGAWLQVVLDNPKLFEWLNEPD